VLHLAQDHSYIHQSLPGTGMSEALFIIASRLTLSLDLPDHPVEIALEQPVLHDAARSFSILKPTAMIACRL
jgi:hypothetical protein